MDELEERDLGIGRGDEAIVTKVGSDGVRGTDPRNIEGEQMKEDDRGAVTGCGMSTAVTMDAGIGQEESGVGADEDDWGTVTATINARSQKNDKCK